MKRFAVWDALIYGFMLLLGFLSVFPFYYVVIVSFSDSTVLMNKVLYILPYSFILDAYTLLVKEGTIFRSAGISVFVTAVGTFLSILIITMAGYGLSKKEAPLRQFFLTMVLITMFFGGQLIPYYVLIRSLKLINSIWVLILPGLMNSYYLIVMKNYFLSVPSSLEESARIDGANDYRILFQILVPISKPILASISLFLAVGFWNEWWHAMLFLNTPNKWPMQMMLKEMLANLATSSISPVAKMMAASYRKVNALSVRMAAIVITTIPILLVYPFVQKYFAKGVMLGSLKE